MDPFSIIIYNGKRYQGILYSPLDEQGKKVGVPVKASKFGKTIGYDVLQQHFEKSKKNIEKNKTREYLCPIIAKALQESQSLGQLKKLLSANNVGVVFRQNDQNRLYEISFIDYKNKAILNGSRLGKDFSANVINDLFKDSPVRNIEQIEPNKPQSINQPNNLPEHSPVQQDIGSDILSPLAFEQHGTDYEAENFAREKENEEKVRKRKKRRGRGL